MGISERLVSGTEAFTNILSGTKKASGHSCRKMPGIFLGMLLGYSITLMPLCAGRPHCAHLGYSCRSLMK